MSGVVVAVGSAVSRYRVGDRVGVGCLVDSCGYCAECKGGTEQYCENRAVFTYGQKVDTAFEPTGVTQGGYSTYIVVRQDFVLRIPDGFDMAAAGPVMCSGVTVYSPLRHWGVRKGYKVGVVGLGGLGHMAVQIATAMGAEVTVFTTSADKEADARRFGAKEVVVNNDPAKMGKLRRSLDFILDTVPYRHEMNPLVGCLSAMRPCAWSGSARGLSPINWLPSRRSWVATHSLGL